MNKLIKVLTLVLALVCALSFTALADEALKAEAFLAEYYGIELPESELLTLDDMNAALALKTKVLSIKHGETRLPKGEHFDAEIIGMEVYEYFPPRYVGVVEDVLTYPAHKLYRVRGEEKSYLIPAVKDIFIVDINEEKREIYVNMMEGLAIDEN